MVYCDECLNGKCDAKHLYHAGQFISDEEYQRMKDDKKVSTTDIIQGSRIIERIK